MQKKVLFTASTFSHILNFHLPYLAQFKRLGWQVHVACGGAPAAGLPEIPGADAVFSLPLQKKMLAAGNFRAARLLRQKIAAEKYALISTHTSLAAFFTRWAMPASRPLLLNMVHGYLFDDQTPALKKTVLLTAEKLTAGCTDLLLTMNRWDLTAAQKHHLGRQIDFIPGIGVDFARFADFTTGDGVAASQSLRNQLGLRPQDWLLVYAAEFSGRKSQVVLLRALAELPRIMADELPGRVVLLLAGQGDKLAECKQLAAQLGLLAEGGPVRAVFPGQCNDMPLWYAAADAAVSASRSEGLPFNIMEAMYAGLPVVASAVKGHVDLLQQEESGLLYPYGDAHACAVLLARLWQEPGLAERLGQNARRQVQQYGLEQVFPQVWAQYEKLIERI